MRRHLILCALALTPGLRLPADCFPAIKITLN